MNLGSIIRKEDVVAAVLWACACSSGSSNGGPTDLSGTAKARLGDYCAKRDACGVETGVMVGPCPTSMCLASLAEEGPLLQFFDCQIAKTCEAFLGDDDCIAAAGTSDSERDMFAARCTAKLVDCGMPNADICAVALPLFRKQWMHAIDACLGSACADFQACTAAVQFPDCWQ